MDQLPDTNLPESNPFYKRVFLAFMLCLVALTIPLVLTSYAQEIWHFGALQRKLLESFLIAGVIAVGIWQLRLRLDKGIPNSIGLGTFRQAIANFSLGFGLLLAPLLLSLLITEIGGWAEISFNWKGARVDMILWGMLSVLLTDAFPEELIFRGYIYSNLLEKMVKWKSAVTTTILFVLFPVILLPLKGLLFPDITAGIVNSLSFGYVLYLFFFGAFAIYLRIITKSIWTGVGFHLMFVYMNQIMGLEKTNLIQFSAFSNESASQLSFVALLVITFLGLIMYPKFKGEKIGWTTHKN